MAAMNCGADTPTKEKAISSLSAKPPRRSAAITPRPMPISSSKPMPAAISCSEGFSRAPISSATSLRWMYERPRSPCTRPAR